MSVIQEKGENLQIMEKKTTTTDNATKKKKNSKKNITIKCKLFKVKVK